MVWQIARRIPDRELNSPPVNVLPSFAICRETGKIEASALFRTNRMGEYEPLLRIGLHGTAVEEGRVSIDWLASLLRDVQLCVRRLGLALVANHPGETAPLVSEAVLWRSCTLDVVAFDAGSFCVRLDVPNRIRKAPWPHYHGQPLAVAAVDRFMDLLDQLARGRGLAEKIPTDLLPPLKRIARAFDHGFSEINFSRLGAATGVREISVRDTVRWLSGFEAPTPAVSVLEIGPPQRPSTARELMLALKENGLIGMWKDRTDIGDTEEFARRLRERAFKRYED